MLERNDERAPSFEAYFLMMFCGVTALSVTACCAAATSVFDFASAVSAAARLRAAAACSSGVPAAFAACRACA